ncbi:TPA: hypothetical protein ACSQIM_001581 [Clostridium perfringens]|uniref:hypothetical protein n=1 Tax=Clostridium perfringens TaxID=1502 RepID=UPI0011595861|nr:hypothetical protein [Clostridium perfringens]EGT2192594.1 hypothetical protein [Clostridium perfringens]EHA0994262.1 hypothetical protein [Clostridium perfringens]EHA1185098.1 hypothetical protein [Clostridium perfringens]EHA6442114.1 hypothetical protein [Clostridium perfringens]EHK2362740.1 hypothetical protein [Clostridium perfringens]
MSKRRRKNKVSENSNQGNFMGGLNPQMLDMLGLGDVDVNKVSEVLSSMGSDGFDMNSINSILNNKDGGKNNSSKNKSNKKGNMNNNPLSAIMGDGNPMGDLSSLMGLLGGGAQGMNPMGNMGNLGAIANMMGGNMGGGNLGATNNVSGDTSMDPIVTMILSLRNFVDPQRARFLDKVLKMYKEGKITY